MCPCFCGSYTFQHHWRKASEWRQHRLGGNTSRSLSSLWFSFFFIFVFFFAIALSSLLSNTADTDKHAARNNNPAHWTQLLQKKVHPLRTDAWCLHCEVFALCTPCTFKIYRFFIWKDIKEGRYWISLFTFLCEFKLVWEEDLLSFCFSKVL